MAKKMNKNNRAKHLPKVGSAAAIAVALSVALATPANAAEIDDVELLTGGQSPAESGTVTGNFMTEVQELPEVNEGISESNQEVLEENEQTAEENEQVDLENQETAEENEELSGGQLENPGLEAPEAPEVPELDTEDAGAYNEAVGDYNEAVGDYNESVEDYNEKAEDYNDAADAYNQQEQTRYEEELAAYEEALKQYEEAKRNYEEATKQHETDTEAYEAYLKAQAEYEAAEKLYQEQLKAYNDAKAEHEADTDAYKAYEEAKAAYEAELKAYEELKAQYDADKEAFEADTEAYNAYLEAQAAYEEAMKVYEEKLAQYNADKAEHEADTDAYNAYLKAQAEYEAAQKLYEEKLAQYNADKAEHDADTEAYKIYEEAKRIYDEAFRNYEDLMDQYEQDYQKFLEDEAKHQEYLEKLAAYEDAKDKFDKIVEAFETEDFIYDEVTDYNQEIENKNDDISEKNQNLENDVDADCVDNIGSVGEVNKGVTIDQEVLDVLNGYDSLMAQQQALEAAGAALEAHAGKDAKLGSAEYAAYLTAVESYNDMVNSFNGNVDAYNQAVDAYNAAVDAYNESQKDDVNSSIGNTNGQGEADWGNINIKNVTFSHIDVKYTAAVGKDKTVTVDAEGKEVISYSDNMTQHIVTGVYTDEDAADVHAEAKENPRYNEDRDGINYYGILYTNNADSGSKIHRVKLDVANNEFGNPNHSGAALDPAEGKVAFYVTLVDEAGKTQGLNIQMDATTVYPEGTYYKAESNDFLDQFEGSDGTRLKTVTIDGEEYYDISGQSVFVISALTCDGMTENGGYFWWDTQNKDGTLNTNGLDLVLNLQTLIEIHRADNAKKVGFVEYELGRTAQASAPTNPGQFTENKPDYVAPGVKPDMPTFDMDLPDPVDPPGKEPVAPTAPTAPDLVEQPGDAPVAPTAPTAPDLVEQPGKAPVAPTAPTAPDLVEQPGDAPVAPTAPTAPEAVEKPGVAPTTPVAPAAPKAPVVLEELKPIDKLELLGEKIILEIPEGPADPIPGDGPVDPTPNDGPVDLPEAPIDDDHPAPANDVVPLDDDMIIPDEDVPLADVPKTGDISGLWAALSFLSMGGVGLLSKKRKK